MPKWITNFLLFLAPFLFVFGIGEIITRLFSAPPMQVTSFQSSPTTETPKDYSISRMPDQLYQYAPNGGVRLTPSAHILIQNHYLSHRDIELSTNVFGFRAPEIPHEKGNEMRVLVLGDSITLGDYVPEAQTYPAYIESFLKNKIPSVRVINAGIGSADIRNEYQILLESGLKTKPDVVLVGLYLNDAELSANLVISALPGIFQKSYFFNYLNRMTQIILYRYTHRDELAGSNQAWFKKMKNGRKLNPKTWKHKASGLDALVVANSRDFGAAWDPRTWEIFKHYFSEMKILAEKHQFTLAVVLLPVRYQVEAEYLSNLPQQYFSTLMEELKIPHHDLLPPLRKAWNGDADTTLYYDQCHLTAEGNKIIGERIAEFLSKNVL